MRTSKKCLVFLVLLIFGLFASSAWAATYYVNKQAPNASDANSGTPDAPWLTIQHAADMVTAGDTVIVKPGVYFESVKLSKTGAVTSPIIFKGEPGAILDGSNAGDYVSGLSNLSADPNYSFAPVDFVRIEGFEIRRFWTGIRVQPASWDWTTYLSIGGNGWAVKNNIIHDNADEGISMWSGSSPEGANIIYGNFLYNNPWTDIHTHQYSVVERNVALSHTRYENLRTCIANYLPGATHQVNNNTVMNGTYGIGVAYPGSEYKNNIVMNMSPYTWDGQTYSYGGFAFANRLYRANYDLTTVNISYNDMFNDYGQTGTYGDSIPMPISPAAPGNISVDPLFVNNTGDGSGDYHLTAGSPCIDAGDPADPAPAGGGSRIDIGAYEYTQQMDIPALISEKHQFYDTGLIDNKGIMTSLDAKLNAAQAALMRGEPKTAKNILNAMINEARAQAGKHVEAGAAQALIEDAKMIQRQIDFIETRSSKK